MGISMASLMLWNCLGFDNEFYEGFQNTDVF
jgi:hypothetical protein